jgi:uncharacterized membrane protein
MSVDYLDLVLRLVHIFAGVFWTGTSFFLTGFLGPSVQATAPEGGKVMQHLLARTRFITVITLGSTLTVISGLWMLIRDSGGLQMVWITTPTGLTLTLGAFFGLVAFLHGYLAVGRPNMGIANIARVVMASGGPPSEEQRTELMNLQAKVASNGPILVGLQILALIGMSINEAF